MGGVAKSHGKKALGWEIPLGPTLEIRLPYWLPRSSPKFSKWEIRWDYLFMTTSIRILLWFLEFTQVAHLGNIFQLKPIPWRLKYQNVLGYNYDLSCFKFIITENLKYAKVKRMVQWIPKFSLPSFNSYLLMVNFVSSIPSHMLWPHPILIWRKPQIPYHEISKFLMLKCSDQAFLSSVTKLTKDLILSYHRRTFFWSLQKKIIFNEFT